MLNFPLNQCKVAIIYMYIISKIIIPLYFAANPISQTIKLFYLTTKKILYSTLKYFLFF